MPEEKEKEKEKEFKKAELNKKLTSFEESVELQLKKMKMTKEELRKQLEE